MRLLILAYGVATYALFFAAFAYLVFFVGGEALPIAAVPKTVDWGASLAPGADPALLNLGLLALFGVQHSIMAREGFKRALTRVIPEAAERSTFVLATVGCLTLLYLYWIPMPGVVWSVGAAVWVWLLRATFLAGAVIVLVSTFLIDHFELFGLRQPWTAFRGTPLPSPELRTPLFYRFVRHPIYAGLLLMFWATPTMTVGHLLLAGVWTTYMLIGVSYEERDLLRVFGERYRAYVDSTPMILPLGRRD